jgi:glycosyltransferase involved in cell wall biosynthesis
LKEYDFILVMPVFNEEEGINTFLKSLITKFEHRCFIIVVDDKSTDRTIEKMKGIENRSSLNIIELPKNLGHGGALVHGLKTSLQFQTNIIITVDGDGQITPNLIEEIYNSIKLRSDSILELARKNRLDGKIRKTISFSTRVLVFLKTGKISYDANTPFRAYNRNNLSTLLQSVPKNTLVPNLWFSIISRRRKMNIITLRADSKSRIGSTKTGSTWSGGAFKKYKKLFTFSAKAAFEFLSNK